MACLSGCLLLSLIPKSDLLSYRHHRLVSLALSTITKRPTSSPPPLAVKRQKRECVSVRVHRGGGGDIKKLGSEAQSAAAGQVGKQSKQATFLNDRPAFVSTATLL